MKQASVFLLCFLAMQSAFANDTNLTLTVDGVTYSNVTWHTVTPATVSIFHQTGVATIPLEKLPPQLQRQFGYDPQKAADYRAAEAVQLQRAAKEAAERKANEQTDIDKGLQKLGELPGTASQETQRAQAQQQASELAGAQNPVLMSILVRQALPDGALVDQALDSRLLYVVGLTGVYDDTAYVIVVAPSGDFEYTTTSGAYKKVPKYQYLGRPDDVGPQPSGNRYWWKGSPIQFH
jgi:hypothetical protein